MLFGGEGMGQSDSAGVFIHVGPLYLVICVQCCLHSIDSFAWLIKIKYIPKTNNWKN